MGCAAVSDGRRGGSARGGAHRIPLGTSDRNRAHRRVRVPRTVEAQGDVPAKDLAADRHPGTVAYRVRHGSEHRRGTSGAPRSRSWRTPVALGGRSRFQEVRSMIGMQFGSFILLLIIGVVISLILHYGLQFYVTPGTRS